MNKLTKAFAEGFRKGVKNAEEMEKEAIPLSARNIDEVLGLGARGWR